MHELKKTVADVFIETIKYIQLGKPIKILPLVDVCTFIECSEELTKGEQEFLIHMLLDQKSRI